jgi:hypothetical protein
VLIYDAAPLDAIPDHGYGQLGNLSTDAENHGLGPFETDADGLFGPTGVALHPNDPGDPWSQWLFIVDTNNSRVLRYGASLVRPAPAGSAQRRPNARPQ